ncbi:MAG: peptidylprolyl isomerase [Chloroflexota bacterium]|nr:MAG: peptidylprolyl isomerase [Chloroflexota bacterium]
MAKKNIKTESKPPPTKRQLTRRQRQQRIQRIIVIAGTLFFVLVVGFIGYGFYVEQIKPLQQPVVKINDTVFDMDYYIKLLELYTQGQDDNATWTAADKLIDIIKYSAVLRRISPDLGFDVSTDEVNNEIEKSGFPDEKVYRDVISFELLRYRLLQSYFDPKVPTECEQVQVQALFAESEDVAKMVADELRNDADFDYLAKQYSTEAVTKGSGGDLGWLPEELTYMFLGNLQNSLLKDISFNLEPGVLSEPTYDGSVTKEIGYWLVEVIEKDEKEGSHTRVILLGSQQEAEEIRARIEAGEDFGALAKEHSQDLASKEQGGDLGWIKEIGIGNRIIMQLALQLEPGVLSQPTVDASVQTKGGYWLVRLTDRDANRAFDDETRRGIKQRLLDDLLNEHWQEDSVETYLTEKQKSWAVNRVLSERGR